MKAATVLSISAVIGTTLANDTITVTVPAYTTTVVVPTYTGQPLVVTVPIGPNGLPVTAAPVQPSVVAPGASAAFGTAVSLYSQSVNSALASISSAQSAAAVLGTAGSSTVVIGTSTIIVPIPVGQQQSSAIVPSSLPVTTSTTAITSSTTTSTVTSANTASTFYTTISGTSRSASSTSSSATASRSSVAPVPPVGNAAVIRRPSISILTLLLAAFSAYALW